MEGETVSDDDQCLHPTLRRADNIPNYICGRCGAVVFHIDPGDDALTQFQAHHGSERTIALTEAWEAVEQRDENHGEPQSNFSTIAGLWNMYLTNKALPLKSHEVAEMMVLLKVARSVNGSPDFDHYVDMCGYATLGAYLSGKKEEEEWTME